jgi:ABC-type transport system involved in multi-copper enzyme maturation permease subunit
MWPVIIRELRVAGRDRWNNWYRVLAAALILLIGALTQLFDSSGDGRALFAVVHAILFCIIWIFVPLATADCISKERREGTLGLLFLTPLKAWDVVIAKSFVHANRALFMWLAAVPVMTLSFLMGGVSRWEVILSVLIHSSSLCCALAAGIIVSALFTEWNRTVVAALLASGILLVAFIKLQLWIVQQIPVAIPVFNSILPSDESRLLLAFLLVTNWPAPLWSLISGGSVPILCAAWAQWMLLPTLLSLLGLALAVLFSGIVVRQSIKAKDRTPSRAIRVAEKVLFPALLRNWARRRLSENPIGWLEQRTWTARTLQWGWVAIMILVYSFIATNSSAWMWMDSDSFLHQMLGWGLLAVLGFTAAGSLRRERENGMLALLLITPLAPAQILSGRVKGLWSQIRWATVLFVGGWIYLRQGFSHRDGDWLWMLFFTVSYLTLPVTGLFCSLWRKSYLAAVAWTILLGILYPLGIAFLSAFIISMLMDLHDVSWPIALISAALLQVAIAYIRGRELVHKLESRSFAF